MERQPFKPAIVHHGHLVKHLACMDISKNQQKQRMLAQKLEVSSREKVRKGAGGRRQPCG
jgi:hypothetical protein